MVGKIKWCNDYKGYDFIEYNTQEDIFSHCSFVDVEGYKTLIEYSFEQNVLHKTDKALQAKKVLKVSGR